MAPTQGYHAAFHFTHTRLGKQQHKLLHYLEYTFAPKHLWARSRGTYMGSTEAEQAYNNFLCSSSNSANVR